MRSVSHDETAIVVGAGIVGIACAHYLSKAGLQVTVIDKGTIAGACSHANCGYDYGRHNAYRRDTIFSTSLLNYNDKGP